ncbi:SAM-dependent methyltransferase [Nocardioides gansuensis]|uniref:SAM-dependent methyltransferase n=1 Tax=Nocardioides gansuensis TaxID=2138300 RepID=A0A2T8FES1_9ACTN|nr:class I SAM-dependent methyltransferase [Nocardioides gansuensis]PVG84189.1 SAM-dependent methyltransferase [Nocardioides gansuensis]
MNDFDKASWDEHYRHPGHDHHGHGRPHPQLVAAASTLTPGSALDSGCGEGADALWLAEQGWRVTAVDISTTALARARTRPGADRVEWVEADLAAWAPDAAYDLVSSQFVHVPEGGYDSYYRALAGAVAPGGTLLVAGHGAGGHDHSGTAQPAFDPAAVISVLDPHGWEALASEEGDAVVLRALRLR